MILVFRDPEELAKEAARLIVEMGEKSIAQHGRFNLFLSGGRTPVETYRALKSLKNSDEDFWMWTHLYWSDERFVSGDDRNSNFKTARDCLIELVPIFFENIHPVLVELDDPEEAARRYEEILPEQPDLVLLGLGEDGHTASLFPHSPAIKGAGERLVVAVRGDKAPFQRITITPNVLEAARNVMVIVTGEQKADALARVFTDGDAENVPGRLVRDRLWLTDRGAVRRILDNETLYNVRIRFHGEYDE